MYSNIKCILSQSGHVDVRLFLSIIINILLQRILTYYFIKVSISLVPSSSFHRSYFYCSFSSFMFVFFFVSFSIRFPSIMTNVGQRIANYYCHWRLR